MDTRIASLKKDIEHYCPNLSAAEWDTFKPTLIPVSYKKETIVFSREKICKQILFISNGILASEYRDYSKRVISRFFKKNDLSTNVVSLLTAKKFNDQLLALTEVQGVLIPHQIFLENYLHADGIGFYFRKKLLNVLLEDKQFISIKTIAEVKYQLDYLQRVYPEILLEVPWKHIANFMGVTPAWLSRILKKKDVRKEL